MSSAGIISAISRKRANAGPPVSGFTVWIDARAGIEKSGGAPATDGDAVTAIRDQSPSGNDPTTITSVTYRTGPSRLEMVSNRDSITWGAGSPIENVDGTLFIVLKTSDVQFLLMGGGTSSSFIGANDSSSSTSVSANIASSPLPSFRADGVALTTRRNALLAAYSTGAKVLATAENLDLSAWSGARILQYDHASAFLFTGDFYEFLYYPSALSSGDRDSVEAWMQTKHGI